SELIQIRTFPANPLYYFTLRSPNRKLGIILTVCVKDCYAFSDSPKVRSICPPVFPRRKLFASLYLAWPLFSLHCLGSHNRPPGAFWVVLPTRAGQRWQARLWSLPMSNGA